MVGISHLQQPCLSTKWLDLIIMRKPNGESHTYACVTERQLSGKQFSIMYIRKRPYAVIRKSKLAGCNIPKAVCQLKYLTDKCRPRLCQNVNKLHLK
jgi:hypothetical protein